MSDYRKNMNLNSVRPWGRKRNIIIDLFSFPSFSFLSSFIFSIKNFNFRLPEFRMPKITFPSLLKLSIIIIISAVLISIIYISILIQNYVEIKTIENKSYEKRIDEETLPLRAQIGELQERVKDLEINRKELIIYNIKYKYRIATVKGKNR